MTRLLLSRHDVGNSDDVADTYLTVKVHVSLLEGDTVGLTSHEVGGGESIKGDVNGDGQVGIGDIISITNYMSGEPNGVTLEQADVNGDGEVGIGDIITVTNIMAGGE